MVLPALAHQPFFEETDIIFDKPWTFEDVSISTVVYATLQSASHVDYFVFDVQVSETTQLAIIISQIGGQADFASIMALLGSGILDAELPERVRRPAGGALVIAPEPGPASAFCELFSRTSDWECQEAHIPMYERGRHMITV